MNPNGNQEDKTEPTSHTSRQTFPKWLEEISLSLEHSHTMHPKNRIFCFGEEQKQDFSPISSNIPSRIPTGKVSPPNEDEMRKSISPKYGRRSISTQLYFENTPKNLSLTSSDYLVPKFENALDYPEFLNEDLHQSALEKSWRSLNAFQQYHKGRLDSAKDLVQLNQDLGELELGRLNQEVKVPNSPTIEKDNYYPNNIHRTKNYNELNIDTILQEAFEVSKSKSSDSIVTSKNIVYDYFGEATNHDAIFERKVKEYKMNVMKEYQLREEIINELFDQNEKITEKIRRKSLQSDNLYRTPKYLEKEPLTVTKKNKSKYTHKGSMEHYVTKDKLEEFLIPELPTGTILVLYICSTWGDKYYVGMNGIEIFEDSGRLASIKQIEASPPDVNVLPECRNDPRIVTNLLDGVNRTQDDMHIWLAPFYNNKNHITIVFEKTITLGMMRIWNYNKSRIHSYRGVKDLRMYLDGKLIFQGEIARASGIIMGPIESFGDTILFTTDEEILEKISLNDSSYNYLKSEPNSPPMLHRPETASLNPPIRPLTGPMDSYSREPSPSQVVLGVKRIDLTLMSNWGHHNMIGLTGLEVIEMSSKVINLGINNISMNYDKRISTMERLFNNDNLTVDPRCMWCTQFEKGNNLILTIDLDDYLYISGLRIWNYNENLDSSYAGVRVLKIHLDNKLLKDPLSNEDIFLLRRAPGNLNYDFVQEIFFAKHTSEVNISNEQMFVIQDNELMNMPQGFVYQFIIYSTWGDQYYCGLNGIEVFNEFGGKIMVDDQNVCAYPESVNVLPHVSEDIRTPDKLIDGINDCHDGSHSWIAPIISKHLNRLYIVMDRPITVSYIKIWNYTKTPTRGVKDFGILVDDLLIYSGTLRIFSSDMDALDCCQTVLFTHDKRILGTNWSILIRNSNIRQDLDLRDYESRTSDSLPKADPSLRPFTSVSSYRKPHTSKSQ